MRCLHTTYSVYFILGLGICYSVLNCLVCIYYNIIIALSIYYIFCSFTSNLPWASCGNSWNTIYCGGNVTFCLNISFHRYLPLLDCKLTTGNGTRFPPNRHVGLPDKLVHFAAIIEVSTRIGTICSGIIFCKPNTWPASSLYDHKGNQLVGLFSSSKSFPIRT